MPLEVSYVDEQDPVKQLSSLDVELAKHVVVRSPKVKGPQGDEAFRREWRKMQGLPPKAPSSPSK